MSGIWLLSSVTSCVSTFQALVSGRGKNHTMLCSAQLRLLSSYVSAAAASSRRAGSVPVVPGESCLEVAEAALESETFDRALDVSLGASFGARWEPPRGSPRGDSLEEEAASCAFVSAFAGFVKVALGKGSGGALKSKLIDKIISRLKHFSGRRSGSATSSTRRLHPARQSWFAETEFALLEVLLEGMGEKAIVGSLLPAFAFSLVGRLDVGHESLAAFIFSQDVLFRLGNEPAGKDVAASALPTLFLNELSIDARKAQLNHSLRLFVNGGPLDSLRCTADFAGGSNIAEGGSQRFLLPLGGIWMWNAISGTVTHRPAGPPDASSGDGRREGLLGIVSHTLHLLLRLEKNSSYYTTSVSDGAKVYHLVNTCMLSEEILGDEFVGHALTLLFERFSGYSAEDFVGACYEHSRLSTEQGERKEDDRSSDVQLRELTDPSRPVSDTFSRDELRALDDFVGDMCNSYIEYGGQYACFTSFLRLFLGRDFPAKIKMNVLAIAGAQLAKWDQTRQSQDLQQQDG